MPIQKPINAGRKDNLPMLSDCSIAGINRLQIDAATITPAAKPASERCTISLSDFFIKNTHAEPSVVPIKGISIPIKVSITSPSLYKKFVSCQLNYTTMVGIMIAAFFVGTKNLKQIIACQSNRLTSCINAKRQPFCYAMNYEYKCLKNCSLLIGDIKKCPALNLYQ